MNSTPSRDMQLVSMRSDVQRVARICKLADGQLPTAEEYAKLGGMLLKTFLKILDTQEWDEALAKLGFGTGTVRDVPEETPSKSAPPIVTRPSNGNGHAKPAENPVFREIVVGTQSRKERIEAVRTFIRELRTADPKMRPGVGQKKCEAKFGMKWTQSAFHSSYWSRAVPEISAEELRPMAGGSGDHPQQMDRSDDLRPDAAPVQPHEFCSPTDKQNSDSEQNVLENPANLTTSDKYVDVARCSHGVPRDVRCDECAAEFEAAYPYDAESVPSDVSARQDQPDADETVRLALDLLHSGGTKKSMRFASPNGTFDAHQNGDGNWHMQIDATGLPFDLLNKISGALFEHFFEEHADV